MRDPSRTLRFALLGTAVVALLPSMTPGSELRAGAAKVNLPIPEGVQLAGFRGDRVASGTHDPLQARVLLLRTATDSVAIVACDLYSFTSRRVSEEASRTLNV